MARVSRIPLDKKTYRDTLDTLDLVLGKMKKDEVRSFLFSLLGKNERIMLSKRFFAILLLNQGVGTSEISRRLKLTKQTISRLNLIKEIKNDGFKFALKKVSQDRMLKEVNNLVLGIAKNTAEAFINPIPKRPRGPF